MDFYFLREDAFGHLTAGVRHTPLCSVRCFSWGGFFLGKGRGMPGFWRNVFLSPLSGKRRPFVRSSGRLNQLVWSPFGQSPCSEADDSRVKMRQSIWRQSSRDWGLIVFTVPYNFSGAVTFKDQLLWIETNAGGSQDSMRFLEKCVF